MLFRGWPAQRRTTMRMVSGTALAVCAAVTPVAAQAPSAAAPTTVVAGRPKVAANVPRTASGKPDLTGLWDFATLTPLERPKEFGERAFLTREEVAAIEKRAADSALQDRAPAAGDPGTYNRFWTDFGSRVVEGARNSLVIDPPDGRIPPLTPAARAREDAMWEKRKVAAQAQDLPSWDRCIIGFNAGPPILPSGYNNNLQIFQTGDTVALLTEMAHDARIVPMDGRPRLPKAIQQWRGDSRGRWEGDTLVIESGNFSNKGTGTLVLDRQFGPRPYLGGITDENFRLTERFTRIDRDTLIYEYTVDDPTIWTRPWTVSMTMRSGSEGLFEYACHEGNYGLANILSAARADEKQGSAPKSEGR